MLIGDIEAIVLVETVAMVMRDTKAMVLRDIEAKYRKIPKSCF